MSNRYYVNQFIKNTERQPVMLVGSFEVTDVGAFASRTIGGVAITANRMGADGNSITVAYTGGGTAGAEVVTVSGTAISVQIESGVSTITQVRTAINASVAAAALVTASGTSATTVATQTALPLQNGDDTDFTQVGGESYMELFQSGTGLFEIQLADSYPNLVGASIMLQRESGAVDLNSQLAVVTPEDELISFRMLAGATETNLAVSDIVYIQLMLRNSSNPSS